MNQVALQALVTAGITTLISLCITLIFNTVVNGPKKLRDKKAQEREALFRQIVRDETQASFRESIENDICIKNGLQVILKNDLKTSYDGWIKKGYAPLDAKDDLERMYQVYHSLGANGVMDAHRDKFLALPTNKEKAQK